MTVPPGIAVAGLAALVMVSAGVSSGTVSWQRARCCRAGSCDPAAAEVTVLMRSLSPVSGLFTVMV